MLKKGFKTRSFTQGSVQMSDTLILNSKELFLASSRGININIKIKLILCRASLLHLQKI